MLGFFLVCWADHPALLILVPYCQIQCLICIVGIQALGCHWECHEVQLSSPDWHLFLVMRGTSSRLTALSTICTPAIYLCSRLQLLFQFLEL